jgi:hypothetical protein
VRKEVQPTPWFTVHLAGSLAFDVTIALGVVSVCALLTVGKPDLIDALITWVLR